MVDCEKGPLTESISDALPFFSIRYDGFTLICSKWLVEVKMLSYRTSFEERTYMSSTASHSI
jgi:hypothetical protein